MFMQKNRNVLFALTCMSMTGCLLAKVKKESLGSDFLNVCLELVYQSPTFPLNVLFGYLLSSQAPVIHPALFQEFRTPEWAGN